MKKIKISTLIVIVILILSACGRGNTNEYNANEYEEETIIGGDVITAVEPTRRTITASVSQDFLGVMSVASMTLNEDWSERGLPYVFSFDFQLHLNDTGPEWRQVAEMYSERLRIEFMAGMAPDLIVNNFSLPVYQFAGRGHLSNFYTLIDNCPVTSRDDFFMNVLEAYEVFGGVYELPLKFFPREYIGINTSLPQHFVDRFAELSYITVSDFVRMYMDILDEQDSITHHGLQRMWDINPFLFNIGYFVDWNARTANFNRPELTELLELSTEFMQRLGPIPATDRGYIHHLPINSAAEIRTRATNYMFFSVINGLNLADKFFRRNIPFEHFIPITDDNGHLTLSDRWGIHVYDVWIPAGENAELAWEVTRHLIAAYAETTDDNRSHFDAGRNNFGIPIKRTLFASHMRAVINRRPIREALIGLYTDEEFAVARTAAIARLYEVANMPMTLQAPMFPSHFITEPFEEYFLGLITSTEALNRMQNSVRLWLIE